MTNFWTNFSHNCRGNSNILLWWFHLSVHTLHTWQNFFSAIQNTISEPQVFSYLPNLLKEWRRLRLNFWTVDNLPADLEVGPEVNFVVVLLEHAASVFGSENGENKANKEDESDTILLKGTQNGIGSIVWHHLLFTYRIYYNTLFVIKIRQRVYLFKLFLC